MKKLAITLAILSTAAAVSIHANPAIGPTISLGPGAVIQKPVQNDQLLSLKAGTRESPDSLLPAFHPSCCLT